MEIREVDDHACEIVNVSDISGKRGVMIIPMSMDAYVKAAIVYSNGALLQEAFPKLNADQREFIKTGITPEEWNEMFGEEE